MPRLQPSPRQSYLMEKAPGPSTSNCRNEYQSQQNSSNKSSSLKELFDIRKYVENKNSDFREREDRDEKPEQQSDVEKWSTTNKMAPFKCIQAVLVNRFTKEHLDVVFI